MPFKSDTIPLRGFQDRRRKLSEEQKKEIRKMYATGRFSLNDLAVIFGVSKKTVLLIVNPHSAAVSRQYSQENWKNWQQTGEKRALIVKEHRRYKHDLFMKGELLYE